MLCFVRNHGRTFLFRLLGLAYRPSIPGQVCKYHAGLTPPAQANPSRNFTPAEFVSDWLRSVANWAIAVRSPVNPEPPPPRPSHVLATYRWPLVIVALGLLALSAFLVFLWVMKRTYDETLARGGRAGEYAVQKVEAVAEKF